jgi:alanine racemase
MSRPIQARIDLSALEHNLQAARRATGARIMAVIKAAAYGHGLVRAAEALNAADGFALLDINEAVYLREAGFRQTLLLLEGFFTPGDLPLAAEYELASVIHSPQQLAMLDAYPRRGNLQVWLKVNSGMGRLGFAPQDIPAAMEKLKAHAAVRDITLMTHFSHADEAVGVAAQLEVFDALAAPYRVARSLANSAALLRYPQTHADWVRPGIMLYGASPFAEISAQQLGLKPVMTLCSEIISVRELKAGESVGYGGVFRAEAAMRIGTVACGYADGYPRHAPSGRVEPEAAPRPDEVRVSGGVPLAGAPGTHRPTPCGWTGAPVLVDGRRTRTLGRVSMDMLSVDLGGLPGADVGSAVTLWGQGLPVEEVAQAAGTISYELLCALTVRVPVVAA